MIGKIRLQIWQCCKLLHAQIKSLCNEKELFKRVWATRYSSTFDDEHNHFRKVFEFGFKLTVLEVKKKLFDSNSLTFNGRDSE